MRSTRPAVCLLLAAALATAPAHAQVNLPALGDTVSGDVDVAAERRLGDQVMREIRRDPDYLDDPLLLEHVQSIWQPLVAAARARGDIGGDTDARFAWQTFLVRDRGVNAFALPGGYVGVYLGLIAVTGSSDELASVLAHELSHVTQRHIARGMVNESRQSLVGMAAMILGVLAASRTNSPDAAQALITGGQAAAIQGMLNFSRDMEREADRVGFALLERAGFAGSGMAAMFEKLEQAGRLNDSNGYPYLRTHPLTTERLGEARTRHSASRVPPSSALGSPFVHELMRARARAVMDPRVESLRRLQALDEGAGPSAPPERLHALVASAQASLMLRDGARARAASQRAWTMLPTLDAPAQRLLRLLHANVLAASGDAAAAREVFAALDGDHTRPVQLARAQFALTTGDAAAQRRAVDELQTRVAAGSGDATAWAALGQLWERLGQPLRALRAQAEAHAAVGDLGGAIDRLRAGQRLAREGGAPADHIEVSVIDARVRDLTAQRRALAADATGAR
jgi:predicted Zn-dependent protease